MTQRSILAAILSPTLLALASCGAESAVDSSAETRSTPAPAAGTVQGPFRITEHGTFAEPWAAAVEPGTGNIFITEKAGTVKFYQPANGRLGTVTGIPRVDYGGQGGLGDIAFAPGYESNRQVYLTWAEAGEGDTRGAAMGRGTMVCEEHDSCELRDFRVIWRQRPKVTGRGHYSHRIAFSPDGQYLFLASGDRQKLTPAQDPSNHLGSVLRLNLDGTPAAGNPLATQDCTCEEIWSYGHRNILGLDFDSEGRLWEIEHGPAGGDELNLVQAGANYGWPTVSNGIHYNGNPIPDHDTRPDFVAPAISWTPVIAPGEMIFYRGSLFPGWRGQAIATGMKVQSLVRIAIDGNTAREVARYPMGERVRALVEAPDGALWVLEDAERGRLLRLVPS